MPFFLCSLFESQQQIVIDRISGYVQTRCILLSFLDVREIENVQSLIIDLILFVQRKKLSIEHWITVEPSCFNESKKYDD